MRRLNSSKPLPLLAAVVLALTFLPAGTASAGEVPVAATAVLATQAAAAPAAGTFNRVTPERLLDTRSALGAAGPVSAHGTVALHVVGTAGVPATGVAAVALTVTAARPRGSGYVTVYPDGAARPATSNVNFTAGQAVANMVIVPVGSNGNVRLFNGAEARVDLLADVTGYFTAGTPSVPGSFRALPAQRLLDTRSGGAPVAAGTPVTVQVAGAAGVPSTGVASVVVNLTATLAAGSGFLTAYASGAARPNVSSLNFAGGLSIANLAVVPVGADGRISVFNGSTGGVQVLVDVVGYYRAGTTSAPGAFRMVGTSRILDTRIGLGASGRLSSGASMPLRVTGAAGIPTSGVTAVVMNLTVTAPQQPGYLVAYQSGRPTPTTSTVNFSAGQTASETVISPPSPSGTITITNRSAGTVGVIIDVTGYFLPGTAVTPGAFRPVTPTRIVDTRATGAIKANQSQPFSVTGRGGLPATGVSSIVLNLTETGGSTAGTISASAVGSTDLLPAMWRPCPNREQPCKGSSSHWLQLRM